MVNAKTVGESGSTVITEHFQKLRRGLQFKEKRYDIDLC